MHLYDLVDAGELNWLMENGYLNETLHPTEPLAILNYSKRAVPGAECWKVDALHHCRGLIWNINNGEIVSRPFKKFWNHGQPGAAEIQLTDIVQVHDKVDGSLGILYREPSTGYPAIATRGSFTSDQAKHATKVLRTKYGDWAERKPALGETLLFEIVYPENRIVLDYGDRDDLVLLGAVEIESGAVSGPDTAAIDHDWPAKAPVAETLFGGPFVEALKQPLDRPNAEGYVIRVIKASPDRAGNMVKLKQEDYLELHRIVTGLSEKVIWRALCEGGMTAVNHIIDAVPDEFIPWVRQVAARIMGDAIRIEEELRDEYDAIIEGIDWTEWEGRHDDPQVEREQRKAFAKEVARVYSKNAWAMFLLWEGRGEHLQRILLEKHLEPVGRVTPATVRGIEDQ